MPLLWINQCCFLIIAFPLESCITTAVAFSKELDNTTLKAPFTMIRSALCNYTYQDEPEYNVTRSVAILTIELLTSTVTILGLGLLDLCNHLETSICGFRLMFKI